MSNPPMYPAPPPAPWACTPDPVIPTFVKPDELVLPVPPAAPESASVTVLRKLLEDRLLTRNTAESRLESNEVERKRAQERLDNYVALLDDDVDFIAAIDVEIAQIRADIKKIGGRVD